MDRHRMVRLVLVILVWKLEQLDFSTQHHMVCRVYLNHHVRKDDRESENLKILNRWRLIWVRLFFLLSIRLFWRFHQNHVNHYQFKIGCICVSNIPPTKSYSMIKYFNSNNNKLITTNEIEEKEKNNWKALVRCTNMYYKKVLQARVPQK